MRSAAAGNTDEVRALLLHQADPNAFLSGSGTTAAHFAIRNQKPEALKLLLRYGATVDATDWKGNSLIMDAVS